MLRVSRDNNLKIPKTINKVDKDFSKVDYIEIQESFKTANDEKFEDLTKKVEGLDAELEKVSKIPFNANDLIVITKVKKLGAYIVAITEKSPKKYRSVFINRMQNYCLDALEYLLEANFIRMDSETKKLKREELQKEAIIKLKLLGYISMLAESAGCILKRQYKQISMQTADSINLIIAWKKSDDARWKRK